MGERYATGRTVLVTGAARGIGAATAARFHERGANVALVGLEPDRLEARVAELGDRAAWFEADVTDGAAVDAAVGAVVERFGGIDVAIANAGVSFRGSFTDQPVDHWVRTVEVNLLGVYRTAWAVVPHLVASGGHLLAISSLSAALHAPMMSAYTASKAGVEAMSNALRQELAPTGASVGTAYFGFVDTDLVRGAFEHPSAQAVLGTQPRFLRTPIPVEQAVDAIERGVIARRARVWAPRWVGAALLLRGAIQPLAEWLGRRDADALGEARDLAGGDGDGATDDVHPVLGVAIRDGRPAGERGSAADLV